MCLALPLSWFVLTPTHVVRGDGSLVETTDVLSAKQEVKEFLKLFKDWRMLALFPMFFSSNYFYTYQSAIVVYLFNARTRALTSLLTGVGSIIGSLIIGQILDNLPFSRKKRSLLGVAFVTVLIIAVWSGGLAFQVTFTRDTVHAPWDWTNGAAVGPLILLMCYYICDSAFQGLAYYSMSVMTNDAFKLARMAGYYKGIQSAGSAVAAAMDSVKTPYLTEHLISWIMMLGSLPICAFVLWKCQETNNETEIDSKLPVEGMTAPGVPNMGLSFGDEKDATEEERYEGKRA